MGKALKAARGKTVLSKALLLGFVDRDVGLTLQREFVLQKIRPSRGQSKLDVNPVFVVLFKLLIAFARLGARRGAEAFQPYSRRGEAWTRPSIH